MSTDRALVGLLSVLRGRGRPEPGAAWIDREQWRLADVLSARLQEQARARARMTDAGMAAQAASRATAWARLAPDARYYGRSAAEWSALADRWAIRARAAADDTAAAALARHYADRAAERVMSAVARARR